MSELRVEFPSKLSANKFENLYKEVGPAIFLMTNRDLLFDISTVTFLVCGEILKLLTLCNYLSVEKKKRIKLRCGNSNVMSYLERLGFFDELHSSIDVLPARPTSTSATTLRGSSSSLMEITTVHPSNYDAKAPGVIKENIEAAYGSASNCAPLARSTCTMLSELLENVREHSRTNLNGFSAAQTYRGSGTFQLAVSDSGVGILESIKPVLRGTTLANLSDPKLIIHMFNHGNVTSRKNKDGGAGLRTCAVHSLNFQAPMWLRLPTCSIHLIPSGSVYTPNLAECRENLYYFPGTHLYFDLPIPGLTKNKNLLQ